MNTAHNCILSWRDQEKEGDMSATFKVNKTVIQKEMLHRMQNAVIIVVVVFQFSTDALSQTSDSLKCWSNEDRLKWSDFRGVKPTDANSSHLKAASAIRMIPTPFRKGDILSYKVKLVFRKYEAWKTDTTEYLLAHEQLHFDIAELSVRKLRKAIRGIARANPNPTSEDFFSVIEKAYVESGNMQAAYDEDTAHGVITEAQAKWKEKVCLELKKLQDFASTLGDCE
jgi:hypothetical protein